MYQVHYYVTVIWRRLLNLFYLRYLASFSARGLGWGVPRYHIYFMCGILQSLALCHIHLGSLLENHMLYIFEWGGENGNGYGNVFYVAVCIVLFFLLLLVSV